MNVQIIPVLTVGGASAPGADDAPPVVLLEDDGSVLSSLPRARRTFLFVVALVVGAIVLTLGIVVWRATDSPSADSVDQDDPGPVLLVPGFGGSTNALEPLARRLRDDGREVVLVEPPDNARGDLADQAQRLADVAERAADGSGVGSVDVVGYSAGGVVARLWVRDLGGDALARRVVTLGSPHHGTRLAALADDLAADACSLACRQLQPDSSVLQSLNAGDETPDGPLYVSIWSTDDEVVTPPDTARLDGALNIAVQSVCPARVSHGALPSSALVLGAVPVLLGTSDPVRPTPQVCLSS